MYKPKTYLYVLAFLCLNMHYSNALGQNLVRNTFKMFTEDKIKNSLLAPGKWHPFPKTPEEWKQQYPDSILQKVIRDGQEALKMEYPPITATITLDYIRTGDSKARYEPLLFQRREILWTLSLAESVEGKGRFTDKIMDGVWAICEETFWGSTSILHMQKKGKDLPDAADPVVDLYAAETASLLAWVDYFNGTALDNTSKLIRERIRYEVKRRVFDPMLTANYFYLTKENPNNWAPWVMSNYVAAQLLLETDENKRAKAIYYALQITNKYINGLGEDGSSDEGPGYWTQSVGCVFDELNLLFDASKGKLSIYQDPFLQKMGSYIYKVHLSGENYVNVGDAVPGRTPNALMLYRYGKATGDQTLMNFASWAYHTYYDTSKAPYLNNSRNSRSRTLYNMTAIQDLSSYPFTVPNVPDSYLRDVQIMTAKAANGMIVAAYGGHNGQNHNHNDVGNVLVYAGNESVITDVGPGAYTSNTFSDKRYTLWFNTSEYHNLPIINGYGQAAGKEYTATDVEYKMGSSVSTFSLNLAKTYPLEAAVKKWNRNISMDKIKGVITLTDNYELSGTVKGLSQAFMTICTTDITMPGKVLFKLSGGKQVIMDYDSLVWSVKKEKMELKNPEDKKFKETFKGKDIWRILMVSKDKEKSGIITYSFHR